MKAKKEVKAKSESAKPARKRKPAEKPVYSTSKKSNNVSSVSDLIAIVQHKDYYKLLTNDDNKSEISKGWISKKELNEIEKAIKDKDQEAITSLPQISKRGFLRTIINGQE